MWIRPVLIATQHGPRLGYGRCGVRDLPHRPRELPDLVRELRAPRMIWRGSEGAAREHTRSIRHACRGFLSLISVIVALSPPSGRSTVVQWLVLVLRALPEEGVVRPELFPPRGPALCGIDATGRAV